MSGYATGKLARIRSATTAAELHELRRAAWQHHGVLSIEVDTLENEWERTVLGGIAARLYGARRAEGHTDAREAPLRCVKGRENG